MRPVQLGDVLAAASCLQTGATAAARLAHHRSRPQWLSGAARLPLLVHRSSSSAYHGAAVVRSAASPTSQGASSASAASSPSSFSSGAEGASAASASSKWRIFNTTLQEKLPLQMALQSLYGIGLSTARLVCGELGLNPQTQLRLLSSSSFSVLRAHVESRFEPRHIAEREQQQRILDKRTQTNARTQRKLGRQRQLAFGLPAFNKKQPPPAGVKPVLTTAAQQDAATQSSRQQAEQRQQQRQQSSRT